MEHLLTIDSLISLITLAVLEIVLGIDNVIFVSILMGRLDDRQKLRARCCAPPKVSKKRGRAAYP